MKKLLILAIAFITFLLMTCGIYYLTSMPRLTSTSKIWQPPPTYTPTPLCSPTPTPTPSCDLTVYLRDTNNAEGFAAFSGEHVDAGWIYTEGGYVYGEIAVRIGSREYHCYQREIDPLGARFSRKGYRMEFKFSDSLLAATRGVEPGFSRLYLRFWAGILDCNSATDEPYKIEAMLYKEGEIQEHTEISFFVVDDPLCSIEAEEPGVVVVATDDLTPTSKATAAATPTPEPPSLAPGLVGPGDGHNFKPSDDILLMWDTPTPLSQDEWYEVQLWREGDVPYTVAQRTKQGSWKVEPKYYPGRYQWRIRVVRGKEGQKEMNLSQPSQTWSFSWLSPVVQAPTASPSPPPHIIDLTVYLLGTNNEQGVVALSGDEHVDAGTIYTEGRTVYGDVAVRIGDTVYHFDKEPAPGEPEQLPAPYRLDVKFSDSLIAATEGIQPGFDPKKAQFWVGTLNYSSAVSDKPYKIEMTLYAGEEARKHTEISFLVADEPEGIPDPNHGRPRP